MFLLVLIDLEQELEMIPRATGRVAGSKISQALSSLAPAAVAAPFDPSAHCALFTLNN